MHVATYYGNVTLVLILLQHGGSPDITNVVSSLYFDELSFQMFHECVDNIYKAFRPCCDAFGRRHTFFKSLSFKQ